MSKILLQVNKLRKSYGYGENRVEVLHGVDMQAHRGEMTAIVGASGSGKTTLLQILGTLDSPDEGTILFDDQPLTGLDESALGKHRNTNIGFIFQFHHLLPEFSALENVMMPGLISGQPQRQLIVEAEHLLEQVGIEHRLHHRPGELSGGEQQRVALARALMLQPPLLLADEPTGNLDTENGNKVFSLLHELCKTLNLCVIMVTHNLELAASLDRKLILIDGKLTSPDPAKQRNNSPPFS